MTEIPDDVMKAAADALLAGGYSVRIGSDGHKAIARAIFAERDRNIPAGWILVPTTCGGCGAPSTYDCYRAPDKPCYREFHNEGTRSAYAATLPAAPEIKERIE